MAWIRRVPTASGATAVQIAESGNGRRRIIAHVGSAHTDAELGLLIERARQLLQNPAQGEFALGVQPLAPRTPLIAQAGEVSLFETPGSPSRERATVAAPRVVGTTSRVL